MDNDSYSEVSTQGWFSRIGESIKGILFGLILFIAAFPLLWWNEGRSVERYNSLKEGQAAVISVAAEAINPANDGKLVHTQGLANTSEVLIDNEFGVSAVALKLIRQVSMYQWKEQEHTETHENAGGSKTTKKTYTYSKEWSGSPINSGNFKQSANHGNPPMPLNSQTQQAQQVNVGAFNLNASQVAAISGAEAFSVQNALAPDQMYGKPLAVTGEGFYLGRNAGDPQIGDLKINFQIVKPQNISLVAQQSGKTFAPYQTQAGSAIDLLEMGLKDANSLFAAAQSENTAITWGVRLGGCFAMWLGLYLLFRPFAVVGSVLPLLGDLISMGAGLLAFFITLPCSMLIIAVAWIAYRPWLAGTLIAIALISVVATKFVPRRHAITAHA